MQVLAELLIALVMAICAVTVLRRTTAARLQPQNRPPETFQTARISSEPVRAAPPPETAFDVSMPDAETGTAACFLIANPRSVEGMDPTETMMNAMTGRGVCTPSMPIGPARY